MYDKAGVSGPVGFSKLPEADKIYWEGWLEGQAEAAQEAENELED